MAYICENLSSTSARRDTRKINGSHLILTDKLLGSICHRKYPSFDSRLASTHSFAMRTAFSESIFGKLRSWFRRSLSHREATALTNLWCIVDCSQYQGAHWCSRWKSWAPAGNIDWGIRQRPALNMPGPRPVAPITSVTPLHYALITSAGTSTSWQAWLFALPALVCSVTLLLWNCFNDVCMIWTDGLLKQLYHPESCISLLQPTSYWGVIISWYLCGTSLFI